MSSTKPLYYRVSRGIGRCHPSMKMKRNGFFGLDCGPDGAEAWAKADAWYAEWLQVNRKLKTPSVTSATSGYVVFVRTATHVAVNYVPEQSNKFELARLSLGEAFESMLIVRGSKGDADEVHRRLASSRTRSGFALAGEVLEEMRRAAEAQRIAGTPSGMGADDRKGREAPARLAGKTARYTTDVTDAQWDRILPILSEKGPSGRRTRGPTRATINAIIHHLRSGQPWSRLPKDMPPHIKVRLAYVRLVERDRWERVEEALGTGG